MLLDEFTVGVFSTFGLIYSTYYLWFLDGFTLGILVLLDGFTLAVFNAFGLIYTGCS